MTAQFLFLSIIGAALGTVFLILWTRWRRTEGTAATEESWVLVDGSNVMHWRDNLPDLDTVRQVVQVLSDGGWVPGVVFDANAGWKLFGRYLHDGDFARLLGLEKRQVLVVEKGTQADGFLLRTAREFGARIVTNDRFRDWADAHPEVKEPGFLIRGGMRDGRVWLTGLEAGNAAKEGAL